MPQGLNFFLPAWLLLWLCILGILAILAGYRKFGLVFLVPPALDWFFFPVKAAIVENTAIWVQVTVSFIFIMFVLRAVLSIIFGKDVATQAIGQLVATAITRSSSLIISLSKRAASSFRRNK